MSRDHEERFRQFVRCLPNGDFAFLHRLQQSGLRLGRRAVDFVGQQNVGEDRPLDETEFSPPAFTLFQNVGAGDVRRHQVGCELNPAKVHIQQFGDCAHHESLGQSGNADQKTMPTRKDRGQNLINDSVLTDDHLVKFFDHDFMVSMKLFEELIKISLLGQWTNPW